MKNRYSVDDQGHPFTKIGNKKFTIFDGGDRWFIFIVETDDDGEVWERVAPETFTSCSKAKKWIAKEEEL